MAAAILRRSCIKQKENVVIPEEIIIDEILTRLPVKTVVQLQCVCKSWRNIISGDPGFVKTHLTRNSMDPNKCGLIAHFSRYTNFNCHKLQIRGSVNGLVCVYHQLFHCLGIWNPATNRFKHIPCPTIRKDEIKEQIHVGFGYDPTTDDYKIVYVIIVQDHELVAHVYSCNSCSWRNTTIKSTFVARGFHVTYPTIVRGCPYWFNFCPKSRDHYYVMSFDMTCEVFKLLPGIDFGEEPGTYNRKAMVNLGDSLAVYVHSPKSSSLQLIDVYVYDEGRGAWSKNYTVGPITFTSPRSISFFQFLENGDIFFADNGCRTLLCINPETHAIDRVVSGSYFNDDYRGRNFITYSFNYIGSLVSVKGMGMYQKGMYQKGMYQMLAGTDMLIIDRSFGTDMFIDRSFEFGY